MEHRTPALTGAYRDALLDAVRLLRTEADRTGLPLALPDAAPAEATRVELLHQLDDYLIPRLESLDAPLLAVVGGSTGAGKSTLVNSLVGQQVSAPGVLRPTTRSPVLVHHPDEGRWFAGQRVLPSLARSVAGGGDTDGAEADPPPGPPGPPGQSGQSGRATLTLVETDRIPAGLALLDAPDIDSVVTENRELAGQLLAAADLWIFVTTAARYADAVPWHLLRQARDRGTAIAIVLDRTPPDALAEVSAHLHQMLADQGLGEAPLFTIAESPLPLGMLPAVHIEPLRRWLVGLAEDAQARADVVRQTLTGAVASLGERTETLARAAASQVRAATQLRAVVDDAYAQALTGIDRGMSDGSLLRGEVLARWQEFVGTGEFLKQVETTVSRMRDRVGAALKGRPAPSEPLGEALQTGAAALVLAEGRRAADTVARGWHTLPGGEALLTANPALRTAPAGNSDQVAALVRGWQDDVLGLVRDEGKDRRATAKVMAYGVNGIGVMLMLVAFAHGGTLVGAEVGIAGGTAVVGQKLLEAIFGDQAVREMAAKARRALLERVDTSYASARARYHEALDTLRIEPERPDALRAAARAVRAAR